MHYCMASCEQYCLMSTQLSTIVCVVVGIPGIRIVWGKDGVCSNAMIPWWRWIRRGFMYTASKWYRQCRVPTGLRSETWQPDMDAQLWAIGKMCPVTAGRPHPDHSRSVQALIPSLSPWSHTCLSATCLPLPLISTQSAFGSCLVTSRRV